jgi:hypothetical protein
MSKKLKATRIGHYVSKKGNVTFKYIVNGSDSQIEEYKTAQGLNFREYKNEEDDTDPLNGEPLFFTTQALAHEVELTITTNGKVIVDVATDDVAALVLEEEQLIRAKIADLKAQERFNRNKVTK